MCDVKLVLFFGFICALGATVDKNPLVSKYIDGSRCELYKHIPAGGIVAEIGVADGSNAWSILQFANPRKLYLIDCWHHQDQKVYKDGCNAAQAILDQWYFTTVKGSLKDFRVVVMRLYSDEAVGLFKDEFFDWIYLDANHGYEAVRADLRMWFSKVKNGGFITGHDYGNNTYGVKRAVDEFARQQKLYITLLTTRDGENNSWAIQKSRPS